MCRHRSELDNARAIIVTQEEELSLHGLGSKVAPHVHWSRCLPGSSTYWWFGTFIVGHSWRTTMSPNFYFVFKTNTNITMITYTYINLHNKIAINLAKHKIIQRYTKPKQNPVGVGQHGQLRLRGNPKLTSIITHKYLRNQIAMQLATHQNHTTAIQQPNTDTPKSGSRGASNSITPYPL